MRIMKHLSFTAVQKCLLRISSLPRSQLRRTFEPSSLPESVAFRLLNKIPGRFEQIDYELELVHFTKVSCRRRNDKFIIA